MKSSASITRLRDRSSALPPTAEQFARTEQPGKARCRSKLAPWREDILFLLGKDYTLNQVKEFLALHQVQIGVNGISLYLARERARACRDEHDPSIPVARRRNTKTLNSKLSGAEICERNGWRPGVMLYGTDTHRNLAVIRITAIGHRGILAQLVSQNGTPVSDTAGRETIWDLTRRDWHPVAAAREKT